MGNFDYKKHVYSKINTYQSYLFTSMNLKFIYEVMVERSETAILHL